MDEYRSVRITKLERERRLLLIELEYNLAQLDYFRWLEHLSEYVYTPEAKLKETDERLSEKVSRAYDNLKELKAREHGRTPD